MTRAFTWTDKRIELLRELKRQGLSHAEAARALGCDVEYVRLFVREGLPPAKPSAVDLTVVPRPVAVRRPGLIDLSKAPSLMEQRFSAEGRR